MMILKKLKILDTGRYIAFDEYEGIEVAWNQVKLNLSHNSLSGSIGDIFTGLKNLKQIDLQSNQFTGSVNFLAGLPLSYLYVLN
ncbi:protein STRUBBELIG-RECEPTOR FAMILY 6-like isoform X7 [Magnolia sinica]|uniref:protein STRUBBELIG-RECEPTOR FAMILY 6-like isoform X7 n=1 Tax=Magnolia sinica TaxID=86752 RepID=UPI00265A529F|nr:protein STRUBBELIG-RECEPTOR FAMILY 6-like isoform X7 [Magnolia sinica]